MNKELRNKTDKNIKESIVLSSLLKDNAKDGPVPFRMPGHKRNEKFDYLFGAQNLDATKINGQDGFENSLKKSMDLAASYFKVKHSRYLINGGTVGILAAIHAITKEGDEVLLARNCHKAIYHAVELCQLKPYYVYPSYFEEYGFYGSVDPLKITGMFDRHPGIKLVVITSPTYEGVLSNIKEIAEIVHANGAILLVDEGHGAHLGLHEGFEQSARNLGADIVVNSIHQTLPSLSQTALLNVCSDKIDIAKLDESLSMFESSSQSYILYSALDSCIHYMMEHGDEELERWSSLIDRFIKQASGFDKIRLFNGKNDGRVFAFDKSKLVLLTDGTNLSGTFFYNQLLEEYNIELEMAGLNYAIASTGIGESRDSMLSLYNAVSDIDHDSRFRNGITKSSLPSLPSKDMDPFLIHQNQEEETPVEKCEGKTSAEYIWAYPPGSPVIVKGEIMTDELLKYAMDLYTQGVKIITSSGKFPVSINTVIKSVDTKDAD